MADKNSFQDKLDYSVTALIDISEDDDLSSAIVSAGGAYPIGVVTPASFTSTAIGIQASFDGGSTYVTVTDTAGVDYAPAAAASKYIALNANITAGLKDFKISTNAAEGADRTLTVVMRPF